MMCILQCTYKCVLSSKNTQHMQHKIWIRIIRIDPKLGPNMLFFRAEFVPLSSRIKIRKSLYDYLINRYCLSFKYIHMYIYIPKTVWLTAKYLTTLRCLSTSGDSTFLSLELVDSSSAPSASSGSLDSWYALALWWLAILFATKCSENKNINYSGNVKLCAIDPNHYAISVWQFQNVSGESTFTRKMWHNIDKKSYRIIYVGNIYIQLSFTGKLSNVN